MRNPLFIQIHTLTSYPASLLNRDDVGFAKRMPFGGVTRTRVSSQCLKRHWRRHEGEHSLRTLSRDGEPVDMAVRSRGTFDRFIKAPLIESGATEEVAIAVTEALMAEILGNSAKAKKAKEKAKEEAEEASVQTSQITVLGRPEIDYLLQEARTIASKLEGESGNGLEKSLKEACKDRFSKEWIANLRGLKLAAGLDAALFGRMVTSDKLSRADAAMHVAHAFTVHGEQSETDYFSAMDDLMKESSEGPEQLGSGHIGNTELTSGLFYEYVVVDVAQLVSNLEGVAADKWQEGDRTLAAEVVQRLIHLMTKVSPGAKLGSTAPYAYAHFAMVETGASQPRTLANAFLKPVTPGTDLLENTYKSITSFVKDVDAMYDLKCDRQFAAIQGGTLECLGQRSSIAELAQFAASAIKGN